MANPTSNFGWQMPTPTDLVTDLPADFEVFGQAVDTSLADLKGGTSGQVLSKNSNTDMDFVWSSPNPGDITAVTAGTGISGGGTSGDVTITNSMATAIDAKGDLIAGTGADTFSRLAAGANGETLVADSSTSTGLRWNPSSSAGKNSILNSNFAIAQRGTTGNLNTPNYYSFDRWQAYRNGAVTGGTWSRVTASLDGFYYAARIQRDSGNSGTEGLNLATSFETTQISSLWGNYLTLSFYARKGANFSGSSDNITSNLYSGTGTDGSLGAGFTSAAVISGSGSKTLTTSWQRFSITTTAPLANTATQLGVRFNYTPTGTAGAADYFEITGVQLEIGQTPSAFQTATGTVQGELAACQRYYYRTTVQAGQHFANGLAQDTTTAIYVMPYPVTMRTAPTALEQSGTATDYSVRTGVTNTTCSGVPLFGNASTQNAIFSFTVASGLVASNALFARPNVNGAYLGWSAEL